MHYAEFKTVIHNVTYGMLDRAVSECVLIDGCQYTFHDDTVTITGLEPKHLAPAVELIQFLIREMNDEWISPMGRDNRGWLTQHSFDVVHHADSYKDMDGPPYVETIIVGPWTDRRIALRENFRIESTNPFIKEEA